MTTLAAYTDGSTIWMASDSAVKDQDRVSIGRSKVIRRPAGEGEALLAVAGVTALVSIVKYDLTLPNRPDPTSDDACDAWAHSVARAITDLAADARPTLLGKNQGDDGPEETAGRVLLGHAGRIWALDANMADPELRGYTAVGSGEEYAFGAMHALVGSYEPEALLRAAVEGACAFDAFSAPPVHIEALSLHPGDHREAHGR